MYVLQFLSDSLFCVRVCVCVTPSDTWLFIMHAQSSRHQNATLHEPVCNQHTHTQTINTHTHTNKRHTHTPKIYCVLRNTYMYANTWVHLLSLSLSHTHFYILYKSSLLFIETEITAFFKTHKPIYEFYCVAGRGRGSGRLVLQPIRWLHSAAARCVIIPGAVK